MENLLTSKLGTRPALIGLQAYEGNLPSKLTPFVTARLNESKKFPKALIPSGMCFADALCMILDQRDAVLHHAVIQWEGPDKYAHAWCVHKGNIIEGYFYGGKFVWCSYPIKGNTHPTVLYHRTYTYKEAHINLILHKMSAGPWDEEIKKHVSNGEPDV